MKANEMRDKSPAELQEHVEGLRKELFQLEMQKYTSQLDKPHRIRMVRREIARGLTIARENQKAQS